MAKVPNWLRFFGKGGAGAVPIVGGFIAEGAELWFQHLEKKPDAAAIRRQVAKLGVRVKQNERVVDALVAALADGTVEEPFREPIQEFAEALKNPDNPPQRIQQVFDRLKERFGDFESFRRDAERRFARLEKTVTEHGDRLDGHDEEIGELKRLPAEGMEVMEETTTRTIRRPVTPSAPAAPAAPKLPIFDVPHERNPNFTGREELLAALYKALETGDPAALTQAISGLGGVGKTQLAVEYAYRHQAEYGIVWWVRCEEPAQLAADYAALAGRLGLPEREAREQDVVIAAVREWLETHAGWLLVLDNVPDPGALKETGDGRSYVPQRGAGHVIITSRHGAWRGVAEPLSVPTWPRDESVGFLLKRTGSSDAAGADALADALGDLPLALEHAAAFIDAAGSSFGEYAGLFRKEHEKVLNRVPAAGADYPLSVAAAWELSFGKLSPGAAGLLTLCAFVAPDDIPIDVIRGKADKLPEPLAAVVGDDLAFGDAVAELRRYSLVERAGDGLSVHRLVQVAARDRLSAEERRIWAGAAVEAVNAAFPFDADTDPANWPVCERLASQAATSAGHAAAENAAPDAAGRVLNQLGLYQRTRAAFQDARRSFERALEICEAASGEDDPRVATTVNNLGLVLYDLGDLPAARKCFERALVIDEAAFGKNHPNVGVRVNNLGGVLQDLGDLPAARKCYERALVIDEAALGPDHPSVATDVNNLGSVHRALGDLPAARKCYERALVIDEAAFGPDHPNVAIRVNNLGSVLQDLGELAAARKYFERALKIDEAAFGPGHPTVARDVNNLGSVHRALGDLPAARECVERALGICRAVYGDDHPRTRTVRGNLASLG